MSQFLAYHAVVHAMEGRSGWTPASRFAAAVAHVINGHLPYERYNAAGLARAKAGATEGQIERAILELMPLDLTPGVRIIGNLSSPKLVIEGFNAYNASSGVAVRTNVAMQMEGGRAAKVVARREARMDASDPHLCRLGTLALFDGMVSAAERNARSGKPARQPLLSELGEMLGLGGSAGADAAVVFEAEGAMPVSELARRLGCHQRSLERKLKQEGLTAEALRQAVRMIRAADRLGSSDSLTTIALEAGFSDLSHMTRSFKTSAGMQPSALRGMLWADAEIRRAPRPAMGAMVSAERS